MSHPTVLYHPERIPTQTGLELLRSDEQIAQARRSVRSFSPDPVPREMIEQAIRIAGTAPSGAHRQPWHFVAVSDPEFKRRVQLAAEEEEREFYSRRATPEWLEALAPLGTDANKEYLSIAPWLVIVFRRDYDMNADGSRSKNYYMTESVGIAVGFFIQALHRAGLATLTHTPAPMTFLREICGRPASEKPFVLMPVGYPAPDCQVPDIQRKPLDQVAEFVVTS
jgi:iodotyrosine deiodinase